MSHTWQDAVDKENQLHRSCCRCCPSFDSVHQWKALGKQERCSATPDFHAGGSCFSTRNFLGSQFFKINFSGPFAFSEDASSFTYPSAEVREMSLCETLLVPRPDHILQVPSERRMDLQRQSLGRRDKVRIQNVYLSFKSVHKMLQPKCNRSWGSKEIATSWRSCEVLDKANNQLRSKNIEVKNIQESYCHRMQLKSCLLVGSSHGPILPSVPDVV